MFCPSWALQRTALRTVFFFHFHTHMRGSSLEQTVIKSSACHLKSLHHPHTMSLLGVPHTTSSFCSTPPLLSPTILHTTGTRKSLNATPRLEGQSGHLADITQSTKKSQRLCNDYLKLGHASMASDSVWGDTFAVPPNRLSRFGGPRAGRWTWSSKLRKTWLMSRTYRVASLLARDPIPPPRGR